MSLRVVVRSPAESDLLESALFIAEDNPAAAQRFLDEAEKAFARLAEFPEIGTPRTAFEPALAGLRLWPVPGHALLTA
jgi:plasmid stabilization system protein ParE